MNISEHIRHCNSLSYKNTRFEPVTPNNEIVLFDENKQAQYSATSDSVSHLLLPFSFFC